MSVGVTTDQKQSKLHNVVFVLYDLHSAHPLKLGEFSLE